MVINMKIKDKSSEEVERDILGIARSRMVFTLNYLRTATGRNYYILKPMLENMVAKGQLEQLDGYGNRIFYRLKV